MKSLTKEMLAGAMAGIAGGMALVGSRQMMYKLTSKRAKRREREIEPRDPFIVLAQKLQKLTGISMTKRQEKLFEQIVLTKLSAMAGSTYLLIARKWPLGWLNGGVVFGTLFWAIEDEGIGPALGLVGDNTKYPAEAHLRGLVSHIIFGVVTAALLNRLNSIKMQEEII